MFQIIHAEIMWHVDYLCTFFSHIPCGMAVKFAQPAHLAVFMNEIMSEPHRTVFHEI
jgi:hypothetical protein